MSDQSQAAEQPQTAPTSAPATGASDPRPVVRVVKPPGMISLDEACREARAVRVADIRSWLAAREYSRAMLFDNWRDECTEVAIVRDQSAVPAVLWIIGDLHADILTLANIFALADRDAANGAAPAFVFLGDFVDRGRHDHETLLLLFQRIMRQPGRVCVIPGNHDIDLRWDEPGTRFQVSIEPAEYCERLNGLLARGPASDSDEIELAKLFIAYCKERPKAVILPDGTLLAHAGFPHTDTHEALLAPANLGDQKCLSDFLWARLSESPKKRPNRGNRGHEFGSRDFAQFCQIMSETVKVPVKRMIRGHDHVPNRWLVSYSESVLTLNAMGRRMDLEPEPAEGLHPWPVVARHVPDRLPDIVRLQLDANAVDYAFNIVRPIPDAAIDDFPLGGPRVEDPAPRRSTRIDATGGEL
jgi:protein phosphatase